MLYDSILELIYSFIRFHGYQPTHVYIGHVQRSALFADERMCREIQCQAQGKRPTIANIPIYLVDDESHINVR